MADKKKDEKLYRRRYKTLAEHRAAVAARKHLEGGKNVGPVANREAYGEQIKPKAKPKPQPAAAKPKPKPAAAAPAKPKPTAPAAAKPKPKPKPEPAASGYRDGQIVVKEGNRFRYNAATKTFKPVGHEGKGARRSATASDRTYRDGQIVVKEGNRFRYNAKTKTFTLVKPTGQGRGRRYNR